jgi:hypothetical protein
MPDSKEVTRIMKIGLLESNLGVLHEMLQCISIVGLDGAVVWIVLSNGRESQAQPT